MVSHKHSLPTGLTSCACGTHQTWAPGLSAPGQLPILTAERECDFSHYETLEKVYNVHPTPPSPSVRDRAKLDAL